MNSGATPETLKYMLGRIPMGRVGEPEEAAEMLALCHLRPVHLQLALLSMHQAEEQRTNCTK